MLSMAQEKLYRDTWTLSLQDCVETLTRLHAYYFMSAMKKGKRVASKLKLLPIIYTFYS